MFKDAFTSANCARSRLAYLNHVFPDRAAVDEVVEGGQLLQLQGGHFHQGRGLDEPFVREIAVIPLELIHDVDGLFPGGFGLADLGFQFLA